MTQGTSVTPRRPGATLFATLAVALVLAGCSGDPKAEGVDGESDSEGRGAGSLVARSPLTGLEIGDDAPEHPVMVVKIDNTSPAEPQFGLSEADLVVEQLVEGGSTRLAALFWENTPDLVGPLRSIRASDIGIARPLEAVLVASGGAPRTVRRITDADIELLRESEDPGYSRDDSRSAPYNLMGDLTEVADSLQPAVPPPPYLPFGDEESWPGGKPATSVTAGFSGVHTTVWRFEKGTGWVRPESLADQGDDFVPDNLLVLRLDVGDAGYLDPAGNPVPESLFYGKGDATLFHDGEAVEGRWAKEDPEDALELTTVDGDALTVPVGHTWIELIPKDTGSLRYQ
jgi:hypothetical protein